MEQFQATSQAITCAFWTAEEFVEHEKEYVPMAPSEVNQEPGQAYETLEKAEPSVVWFPTVPLKTTALFVQVGEVGVAVVEDVGATAS